MSEPDRCPECRMSGGFHQWSCGSIPAAEQAAHFERYAKTFLNGQERYREATQQRNRVISALQGKCAVLKHENNKLRSWQRRQRVETPVPEE